MTDETKKMFDAPWTVKHHVHACWEVDFEISTVDRMRVAVSPTEEHANRISRLPELYDALAEVMYEGCGNCCRAHDPSLDPTFDCFVDEGCPFNQRDCFFGQHWAILRKVRDGE